ncbi:MAG: hypothetical protein M3Q45_15650 [Chloroflexota bacterium]|nr:hypothetical protein [Chloroflexota bacterium]
MALVFRTVSQPSITNEAPTPGELRRNDVVMVLWLALMLLLGIGLRSRALNASRSLALGEDLPRIAYPAGWSVTESDELTLQAKNLASVSTFDSELTVFVRALKENETLDLVRSGWGMGRSTDLTQYRELDSENVLVGDNLPGLLTSYAYIADPSLASGANGLPVVVEAQDLLFVQNNQLVAVTMAADADEWDNEAHHFRIVQRSLDVQPVTSTLAEGGQQ